MTKNDLQDSLCLQETAYSPMTDSFDIVLVDIKKAAENHEIHCIRKHNKDTTLNFLAISYRWGEVPEVCVDTKLGYTARIGTFSLNDFYTLCKNITLDSEWMNIDYIWVDAICLKKEDDCKYEYERPLADYQHMNDIYDRADFILVVPDFHLSYLTKVSNMYRDIMHLSIKYNLYIYYLLHGNTYQVNQLDKQFSLVNAGSERKDNIRRVIHLLEDLFMDWASRTWSISMYQHAKRKNIKKLKYWFLELGQLKPMDGPATFFNFDFGTRDEDTWKQLDTNESFSTMMDEYNHSRKYIHHHLNQKTFLEMILTSKCSINAHRFYAIFPLSKYKNKLISNTLVDITHLVSVKLKLFEWLDTKDKLDLLFLASSDNFNQHMLPTFATRSTYLRYGRDNNQNPYHDQYSLWNFDMSSTTTITIQYDDLHQLKLKAKEYYTCSNRSLVQNTAKKINLPSDQLVLYDNDNNADCLDIVCIQRYHSSIMTDYHQGSSSNGIQLFLIGSFIQNKWIVIDAPTKDPVVQDPKWILYSTDEIDTGFNIY